MHRYERSNLSLACPQCCALVPSMSCSPTFHAVISFPQCSALAPSMLCTCTFHAVLSFCSYPPCCAHNHTSMLCSAIWGSRMQWWAQVGERVALTPRRLLQPAYHPDSPASCCSSGIFSFITFNRSSDAAPLASDIENTTRERSTPSK